MKHRILLPFLLQLVDGKSFKKFLLSLEIAFQSRYEQRLSKSSWTTQKVNCSIMNQIIDQARLIEINIAILYELFETLYADRIFHIAAFLILSAKLQKIMIRAKEYPEKITRCKFRHIFMRELFFERQNVFYPSPKRRILLYNSHFFH